MKAMLARVIAAIKTPAPAPLKSTLAPKIMQITDAAMLDSSGGAQPKETAFNLPKMMPGVLPVGHAGMAMDDGINSAYSYSTDGSAFAEGQQFLGYPYLSQLTQRAEYRRPAEILAKHMTRKWIKLQVTGEGDKTDKLKVIEAEIDRLDVKRTFCRAAEIDGYFGRAQIYVDMGTDTPNELKTPLALTATKVGKDSFLRLVVIEPQWTYPQAYNSSDPLDKTFYKPQSWFVMGKEIHASRLLTIVGRQLPDLLKPAYAFGGLSLSQMAKPYVDNWLRTRQSVSDLLHSFTVFVLKTDMTEMLSGGAAVNVNKRAQLFTQMRDNRNLLMLNKETEEFENISASLAGLDKLQAQAQEHMSAATGIPLSILLGITPSGLNASTDGEIRQFYDWIEAQQEAHLSAPLTQVLQLIQLSKFGEIDPEIGFMWEPLWSMDAKQLSDIRKVDADADAIYIANGVISAHESRARLASDDLSPYTTLDIDNDPTPPTPGNDGDPSLEGDD